MPAIAYYAEEHANPAAMIENYRRARRALWNTASKPLAPSAPEPDPPLVYLTDDEYSQFLHTVHCVTRKITGVHTGKICRVVAGHYGVTIAELLGNSRQQAFVRPRFIVMYILVRGLRYSFPRTGMVLGKRDHTTVLHGFHKTVKRMREDASFAEHVHSLMRSCGLEPA